MIKLAPSTNPSPEDELLDYAKKLQSIGVEFLHCDVMDGEFVENYCLPASLIKEISDNTLLNLDIHLMIERPLEKLKHYLDINANFITVHYEAFSSPSEILKAITLIQKKGILAGISIKPSTSIREIMGFLPLIDLVLVMSVQPGKSGQSFMPEVLDKITKLKQIATKNSLRYKIEVDGGINLDNAQQVVNAGADILVMGSAFYNSNDKQELLNKVQGLKNQINI